MAITYPLALPSTMGIASVTLRAANVVGIAQSPFTFRQQVFKHDGERWEASVTLPRHNRANVEPWLAFLLSLKGQVGSFLMGDPANAAPRGAMAGSSATVQVATAADARSSSLALKGLPNSVTGALLPGDYIQLGGGASATMHKLLLSVNSNGSGEATAEIWPALRRDVSVDEDVVYENAVGRFRLTGNTAEWSIDTARHYGLQFEAVEVIP